MLFEWNYEITNYFYPQEDVEGWWNYRFKVKAVMQMIFAIALIINVTGWVRIATVPIVIFTIDDVIDRTIFNSPDWHWTDHLLIISTAIIVGALIWREYVRPGTRFFKGFY